MPRTFCFELWFYIEFNGLGIVFYCDTKDSNTEHTVLHYFHVESNGLGIVFFCQTEKSDVLE